jgi:thiol-disulfide isomerase/thioredoxin
MHLRWHNSYPVILLAGIFGCAPSPNENTPITRLYDTVSYLSNVSRLFGDGGNTVTDNIGTFASNLIWKDSSGAERSLDEFIGSEVIVLNMWATWCGPCREELPDLQEIADEYADDGVRVIGISIDRAREPFSSVYDFATYWNISYQLIVDSSAVAYMNYGGNGSIPRTYIIDRNGYIRYTVEGRATKEEFIEAIETLL